MDRTGSVEEALALAERALPAQPALALAQAEAVLEAVPGHPRAELGRGAALARLGRLAEARAVLAPLAATQKRAALVHLEYGIVLGRLGETEEAITALRHAAVLKPDQTRTWRALADQLSLAGRGAEADAAHARALRAAVHDPELMRAGDALVRGALAEAEAVLRGRLRAAPTDIAALRMLAEVATRLGRNRAAEALLRQCLDLAPGFTAARYHLAVVLFRQNQSVDALPLIERAVAEQPDEPNYKLLLAAALASTGFYDRAIAIYAALLSLTPSLPRLLLGYGHALRTAGRRDEAIAAYRRITAAAPTVGEAWWSLANLKLGVLDAADLARMRAALAAPGLSAEDRYHLHYAIGRALDDAGETEPAFAAYAEGALLRRAEIAYDADATTAQIDRTIAVLTPEFLAGRASQGCPDPSPIFIVGLPRSGSTLIEQMLASHSQVEGTMELPELITIAREIGPVEDYPRAIAALSPEQLRDLGARYLARSRIYRRTGKPYFIDKLPNNWVHVGLIRLILPNAKIIDARRDAMATCFSVFRQHFAKGQNYSYDLVELGRYYNDYLRLMRHFATAAPGLVHLVHYERMVEETEATLRGVLEYCGLAFEDRCLRFFENDRPVRTASSEQVRRPIYREGLRQWERFGPFLGPLKDVLAKDCRP